MDKVFNTAIKTNPMNSNKYFRITISFAFPNLPIIPQTKKTTNVGVDVGNRLYMIHYQLVYFTFQNVRRTSPNKSPSNSPPMAIAGPPAKLTPNR